MIKVFLFSPSQEEDEKERLSQVKELHEEDGGDNTEPLEDLFLGLSVEEVRASCNSICPSERTEQAIIVLHHAIFPLSEVIFKRETRHLHFCPSVLTSLTENQ